MKKISTKIAISLFFAAVIFVVLLLSFIYPNYLDINSKLSFIKESFSNLTPGKVNTAGPQMLLQQPLLNKIGVSNLNSSDLMGFSPVFPANSTKNNNIRYWKTPNTGNCSPPEMCGGIYSSDYTLTASPPPNPPGFSLDRRVNFYKSHEPYEEHTEC